MCALQVPSQNFELFLADELVSSSKLVNYCTSRLVYNGVGDDADGDDLSLIVA